MKTITNKFKLALVAVGLLAIGTVSAQITDASNTTLNKDADATKVVKLVDNKGTIKYIQSKNGITQVTSTVAGNKTVTTWQLGGILEDNTYITADTAKEFALDGLELVTAAKITAATNVASTNAVDREDHDGNAATGGTGFTVLIRDEDSGAIQKIQLVDLLDVDSIGADYTQAIGGGGTPDAAGDATANVNIAVTGLPIIDATNNRKLFVFRNGVKLRWGTAATLDFNGDTAEQITIIFSTDIPMYADDVIEIQYVK